MFAQPPAFAQVSGPTLVEAQETVHVAAQPQGHHHVTTKAPVGQHDIPGLELLEQTSPQPQFVIMFIAFGVGEQLAGAQAENADQF